MKRIKQWRGLMVGVFLAVSSGYAQPNVIISEFMAFNTQTLLDEDGEPSDWIEIYNPTRAPVNLLNWSLTDDVNDLTQWRFPATNIGPNQFVVVFASSKNRRVAGAELHTNFRMAGGGEYLALVMPDGTSIASEFKPQFPPQAADVSYGLGAITTNLTFIRTNDSLVRVKIPSSAADGTNWWHPGFNDSSWILGTNGVGFGSSNVVQADYGAAVLATAPVGYWRLGETSGTTATNRGSGTGINGTYANVTLGTAGPRPPQFNGFEPDNKAPTLNGSSSAITTGNSLLNNRSAFTIGGWIKPATTPGSRIGLFGQNDCVEFGFSSGTTLNCWTPNGGSVSAAYAAPLNTWHHVAAVGDGATIRVFVDGVQVGSGGSGTSNYGSSTYGFNIGGGGIWDTAGNWFNGQIDEVVAYHRALSATEVLSLYSAGTNAFGIPVVPFVKTDVGTVMSNVNASAYLRMPFVVENPSNIVELTLRMRYNDGFVAYINGSAVASANAPASPAYNSTATDKHSALTVDDFRFGGTTLVPGTNILAIHGLNVAVNDPDFLIVAELAGAGAAGTSTNFLYFADPSPGAPNAGGVLFPGPSIVNPTHTPNVPADDQDLVVTASLVPTFHPVSNIVVRYRTMFGPEVEAPMFDDGTRGDSVAGDGMFSAILPISGSTTNGEMVRWRFVARDVTGTNSSRWPLYTDPAGSAEYLGTIVEPPVNLVSKLPIIHLFGDPANFNTTVENSDRTGGRVAVFYDGEFYDNVFMRVRGNTTRTYLKKSHRLEFNREHLFRHPGPGGQRLEKTSFVADYPDPTYMRQGLSFWLADLLGSPGTFYHPIRFQLNTEFYQLANHNDLHGEEMLERLGYDPNGALYNAAGTVVPGKFSTGGFDKKTRNWDNDDDYLALANALSEALPIGTREVNVFDYFDLPNVINYLVVARWAHENDDVWANMSLYHDNDGDNLWRIIGFDMNLSWGAIFYEGGAACQAYVEGVQATNDVHKAHPFYGSGALLPCGSANYNRVYDAIFRIPRTREMFLRRMRTMLDTFVLPIGTPVGATPIEQKILAWRDLIFEEAERDRDKWGWPAKGGQCNFNPGIRLLPGVDAMLNDFFHKRRIHFYGKHSVTNTALPVGITKTDNAGIPLGQLPSVDIYITGLVYNPASGNQAEEYVCLTNPIPFALDVSDWELSGGVSFKFRKGTVIPGNDTVYVSPDLKAFKNRSAGPRGGQGLFVVGPYSGQLSARGETLVIRDNYGRSVTTNSFAGTPSLAQRYLRITELMYHPLAPVSNPNTSEEFEYVELKNISASVTLDLSGIRFTNGIEFTFTGGTLAPGQRVVVAANAAAFAARYGAGATIAGQYSGLFDNGGERVQLVDADGEEILDFSYSDDWYPVTDGLGFSLVVVDETAEPDQWNSKTNWKASGSLNGSPGTAEPPPSFPVPVLVNEVLSRTDVPPPTDSIELYNPTSTNANIGGWYLTDDFNTPKKYRIPDGTTIPAGGYRVFDETQFNPVPGVPPSFGLSSDGDEVYLFSANAAGELTGYVHGDSFGAADNGVTFGRHVTSEGKERLVAQQSRTLNASNSGPRVGPLVISEIMYHPPDVVTPEGTLESSADEFVELVNLSSNTVSLHDPLAPTNRWKVTGGIDYEFPPLTEVAPGEHILLVNFNPADAAQRAAFEAKYGFDEEAELYGPYGGKLNNAGDNVELKKPATAVAGSVPYVLMDKVDFTDASPWPAEADGYGLSLQRLVLASYGNDPTNWVAAPPTPEGPRATGGLTPTITVQPVGRSVLLNETTSFSVGASGTAPLQYQWLLNGTVIPGATGSSLQVMSAQATDAGHYAVLVYNAQGSALSQEAFLTVLSPALILAQPQNVYLTGSTNVSDYGNTTNGVARFSVTAYSPTPLAYQWRFNGVPIPGATDATLTVANVRLSHQGHYDVVVTDANGSIVSEPAYLGILLMPVIVVPPLNQEVPIGGTFSASVQVLGGPPPFMYQWRRGSAIIGVEISDSTNSVFTYGPVTSVDNSTTWRIALTNAASPVVTRVSKTFSVSVQADFDNDGLPDPWEVANGFSTNDPVNASLDLDGDGMTLSQEYVAGTDWSDANNYLRVDGAGGGGSMALEFLAVSNRTYTIEYTGNLGSPGWERLADFPATATNRVERTVDPSAEPGRYYRLVTPGNP